MNRLLPTILAGFLLIGEQAGVIGWYENAEDCAWAVNYIPATWSVKCIPDRHAIELSRKLFGDRK